MPGPWQTSGQEQTRGSQYHAVVWRMYGAARGTCTSTTQHCLACSMARHHSKFCHNVAPRHCHSAACVQQATAANDVVLVLYTAAVLLPHACKPSWACVVCSPAVMAVSRHGATANARPARVRAGCKVRRSNARVHETDDFRAMGSIGWPHTGPVCRLQPAHPGHHSCCYLWASPVKLEPGVLSQLRSHAYSSAQCSGSNCVASALGHWLN